MCLWAFDLHEILDIQGRLGMTSTFVLKILAYDVPHFAHILVIGMAEDIICAQGCWLLFTIVERVIRNHSGIMHLTLLT